MLIFDYVSENKSYDSSIPIQNVKSIQPHESNQPSLESLAESLKRQCSETGLIPASKDFLLTNPNVARCEDDIARYVTMIKIMIRKYSPQILHQLFDSERKRFPVFEQLIQYSIHVDVMIKNAARLSLLFILKECQEEVRDYVIQYGAPKYAKIISIFLNRIIFTFQDSVKRRKENSIIHALNQYEEEIEYIDDLFRLEHEAVIESFRTTFIQKFIVPILTEIAEQNDNNVNCEISLKVKLFLIAKLLKISTNKKFKKEIIELLLPMELQDPRAQYFLTIFNTTSTKVIIEFRDKIVRKIKSIVSSAIPNFSQMCALQILCIAIESFSNCNDNNGVFVVYKTFAELLMKHFVPGTSISKFEIKRLDFIYAFLETAARMKKNYDDTAWFKIKSNFAKILQAHYLELSKQLKFDNISESTNIIDQLYDDYLNCKSNFSYASEDIVKLIISRNDEKWLENGKCEEIDIEMRKLFHLRNLCLHLNQKREKILPLLSNKKPIGEKLSTGNCIACEILVRNIYATKCFLKLNSRQIMILQDNGSDKEGIVVFCSYYKDLTWKKYNETLLLKENRIDDKKTVPVIQLKLKPSSRIRIISETLALAKQKQNEILKRKLDDLLEIVYSQNKNDTKENILN